MIGVPDAEGLVEIESAALERGTGLKTLGTKRGAFKHPLVTAGLLAAQWSKVLRSSGPNPRVSLGKLAPGLAEVTKLAGVTGS